MKRVQRDVELVVRLSSLHGSDASRSSKLLDLSLGCLAQLAQVTRHLEVLCMRVCREISIHHVDDISVDDIHDASQILRLAVFSARHRSKIYLHAGLFDQLDRLLYQLVEVGAAHGEGDGATRAGCVAQSKSRIGSDRITPNDESN